MFAAYRPIIDLGQMLCVFFVM